MSTTTATTLSFASAGVRCDAWHFAATSDALAGPGGRPVLVMAHGLGGTKDSGLEPFARAFADAGLDVVVFDYRGFGASEGSPRQRVRIEDQVADYHAAIAAAQGLPGVDRRRVVLWGVSLSGGHVLRIAADRTDIAAVVSVVPMVDGLAAGRHAMATHTPAEMLRATGLGIKGRVTGAFGGAAVTMPLVARPGELGAMTLEGAYEDYLAIAGPTWRNEIHADIGLELGTRKPAQAASRITAPLLVQIADFDRSAPPYAAAKAAFKGKAEVRHYPCDHFDLFPGKTWHEPAVAHAVAFLTRHLGAELTASRQARRPVVSAPSPDVELVETPAPDNATHRDVELVEAPAPDSEAARG
jgi:pimeloyl-ACP methyl ester carboxylesterase